MSPSKSAKVMGRILSFQPQKVIEKGAGKSGRLTKRKVLSHSSRKQTSQIFSRTILIRILAAKTTNENVILVFGETPLCLARDRDVLKISQ